MAYLRGTSTSTGLEVQAFLWEHAYATGQSVLDTDCRPSSSNGTPSAPTGTTPFGRALLTPSTEPPLQQVRKLLFNEPLAPDDANGYLQRGLARSKLADHSGAIEDNKKTIELNPSDPLVYHYLGFTYQRLGDNTAARENWKLAAERYQDQGDQIGYQQMQDAIQ